MIKLLLTGLLCFIGANVTFAQTTPPPTFTPFSFSVTPPTNSVFIAETANPITLIIRNSTNYTNITVTGLVATNLIGTNMLGNITNNPNITTGGDLIVRFAADPKAADDTTPELTNRLSITTTSTITGYVLPIRVTIRGEDLNVTGLAQDQSNLLVTNIVLTYLVNPRPQNNNFTNAFKIDPLGGVVTGSNNLANLEPREPVHASLASAAASVWWTFAPNATTNVLVDTAGSAFTPVLAVYAGTALSNLTLVAASTNDAVNRLQANVSFLATRGTTYRLAVSGSSTNTNAVGNIRLRVVPGGTPDTRPPAIVINTPTREALVGVETLVVSGVAREPSGLDAGISNVVVQVNSSFRTNAFGTTTWSASVTLPPGTNVVRAFAIDYAGNVSAEDAVVVRFISPTNDYFASAFRLAGVGGVVAATNTFAGREPGEPLHAENDGGRSIWYSFRAPANGTLSLTTAGSTLDTLLALYTGDRLTNLVSIAANDDAFAESKYSELIQDVVSNQVYYVAVDAYGSSVGSYTLQYAFVTPQPGQFFTLAVNSLPGGRVSPPGGTYPSGARVTLSATPDQNYEFVSWDGTGGGVQNPLTVVMSQDVTLTARFRASITNVTDDFEAGNLQRLRWASTGNASWFVQTNVTFTGKYSIRSGVIADLQKSTLTLATNLTAGAASFDLKVSSEDGWDYLEFFLNGTRLNRWSGEVDWTNFTFAVPAGINRLEWVYSKDANFSTGLDAVFIDNIFVPIAPVKDSDIASRLFITRLPNRQMQLSIQGFAGRSYDIETSTDLVQWNLLATRSSDSGVIQYLDSQSANQVLRYYRAVAR